MSRFAFPCRVATVVVVGALFMSSVAHSQSRMQYTYAEISYARAEIDKAPDANIFSISGSYALDDRFFGQAGYARVEYEKSQGVSADENDIFVGLG